MSIKNLKFTFNTSEALELFYEDLGNVVKLVTFSGRTVDYSIWREVEHGPNGQYLVMKGRFVDLKEAQKVTILNLSGFELNIRGAETKVLGRDEAMDLTFSPPGAQYHIEATSENKRE